MMCYPPVAVLETMLKSSSLTSLSVVELLFILFFVVVLSTEDKPSANNFILVNSIRPMFDFIENVFVYRQKFRDSNHPFCDLS